MDYIDEFLWAINFVLLLTFIVYASIKLNVTKTTKWILVPIGILLEIGIGIATLFLSVFVPYGDIHSCLYLFWILQFCLICLYRIHKTKLVRIIIGVVVMIALGIYMYYNGTVASESYISSSFNFNPDYKLYQLATYSSDVLIPFSAIYNLLISPFWTRNSKWL